MSTPADQEGDHALSLLADAWDKALQHWHDDMARDFDTHHVRPLLQETRCYLDALRTLSEVLNTATQDP